ncbi:hypothetical protein DPMN_065439 [Dreissena polymorpha]|uniref:Uncharacterized protein n=1 Tax=Dreissena polymorpha TaxID=45954 RepID=A0A9D3YW00_DREPO|nr:hypothetical protein DPMN_065439 [Dreissena polymorpha]
MGVMPYAASGSQDHPARPHSLVRSYHVHKRDNETLLDCANAQAGLELRWPHTA